MIIKHKNNIIAKCLKQSSNIDEENTQFFDINQQILKSCLKSPIICHLLCIINYKNRLKLLNDLENKFSNYEKRYEYSKINKLLLIKSLVSKFEAKLFSEAVADPTYAHLHCLTLLFKLCTILCKSA